MKTTLTPVTAIFVPFGYVVLAIGFVRYLLLRHRKERALLLALTLFLGSSMGRTTGAYDGFLLHFKFQFAHCRTSHKRR